MAVLGRARTWGAPRSVREGRRACVATQWARTSSRVSGVRGLTSQSTRTYYRPASPAYCPPVISDVRPQMQAPREHSQLLSLIRWIDENTSGLSLPTDERHMLAVGCFDVALEHQAAIALLHASELPGSALALLRVLAESLVRGLWVLHC